MFFSRGGRLVDLIETLVRTRREERERTLKTLDKNIEEGKYDMESRRK